MKPNNEQESRQEALSILWAAYYKTERPTAKRIVYHGLNHVRGFAYEVIAIRPAAAVGKE